VDDQALLKTTPERISANAACGELRKVAEENGADDLED
jgi:hypothetical protein